MILEAHERVVILHTDGFDGAKGFESIPDVGFANAAVDAANIDLRESIGIRVPLIVALRPVIPPPHILPRLVVRARI